MVFFLYHCCNYMWACHVIVSTLLRSLLAYTATANTAIIITATIMTIKLVLVLSLWFLYIREKIKHLLFVGISNGIKIKIWKYICKNVLFLYIFYLMPWQKGLISKYLTQIKKNKNSNGISKDETRLKKKDV